MNNEHYEFIKHNPPQHLLGESLQGELHGFQEPLLRCNPLKWNDHFASYATWEESNVQEMV